MKVIYRYIIKQVSIVFLMCLIVFTFVLFIGNMLRIIEMMSKGVGLGMVVKFLILLVPFMLSYSIPISILTSVLLVYARLSADNEITAIRASGINLKYILKPVVFYTIILVSLCYIINDRLRPNAIYNGRKLLLRIGIQEPAINISSGRFNEVFPNYVLYVGQKQGKLLKRVVLYKFEEDRLSSVITAETGQLFYGDEKPGDKIEIPENKDVYMKLFNGVVEEIPKEEQGTGKLNRIQFDSYIIEFDIKGQMKDFSKLDKKEREMTNSELLNRIKKINDKLTKPIYKQLIPKLIQEASSLQTRVHSRLAMSFSCLAFVLVGIPLGIKTHRKETSIGAGISLMLISGYYFIMTLGEAFQNKPNFHPWILMWIPNIILILIGAILIHKLLRK